MGRRSGAELAIEPLKGARFGAAVIGADPKAISDTDRELILAAHRNHLGLLCFEFDRLLDADELHALTAIFGPNEYAPGKIDGIGKGVADDQPARSTEEQEAALRAKGDDPYMTYLGNLDPRTMERRPVGETFFGQWDWHTDMSYLDVPPTFSLLHARQIPAQGGDTAFCSQVLAARALPAELRRRVSTARIKHDSTFTSSGAKRPGMEIPDSPIEALGAAHPVLRRIPGIDGEALFLGRRPLAHVVGLTLDDSEQLLDELWAHATQPRFGYRHRWRVGQVVVWDNRMLLHKRYPMDESDDRLMWRTQTRGEAVIPAT